LTRDTQNGLINLPNRYGKEVVYIKHDSFMDRHKALVAALKVSLRDSFFILALLTSSRAQKDLVVICSRGMLSTDWLLRRTRRPR
jgi:hypothetical protein